MKIAAVLLCIVAVSYAAEVKRQISLLSLAVPAVSKLLVDKLGVDKLIGKFVGNVQELVKGKKGQIPLEGTKLVLDYDMNRCRLHGKRFIIGHLVRSECTTKVCENHITHTCKSCKKGHQTDALKCAMQMELAEIQRLAKQAQATQG